MINRIQGGINDLTVFNEAASVASYYPLKKILGYYEIPNPFELKSIKEMSELLIRKLNLK